MNLTDQERAICEATGTSLTAFEQLRDAQRSEAELQGAASAATVAAVCDATGIDEAAFHAASTATDAAPPRGITGAEMAVCKATGISPDAFMAVRDNRTAVSAGESTAVASCSFEIHGADPVEIQLTPAGDFKPWDGRKLPPGRWHIDSAVASQVIARFAARTNPRVVDYEHQTLHKETNGHPAPAAGWITGLTWREGKGLFGTVELTAKAKQAIADGEYKYVSPVFSYDRTSGNVLDIQMAALTNMPALDGMRPLAG